MEVPGRLHAALALGRNVDGRSKCRQVVVVGVVHVVPGKPLGFLNDELSVQHVDALRAANSQALEILGAHDSPHTRTTGGLSPAVNHTGIADHLLAARANTQVLDLSVVQLAADGLLCVGGQHTP